MHTCCRAGVVIAVINHDHRYHHLNHLKTIPRHRQSHPRRDQTPPFFFFFSFSVHLLHLFDYSSPLSFSSYSQSVFTQHRVHLIIICLSLDDDLHRECHCNPLCSQQADIPLRFAPNHPHQQQQTPKLRSIQLSIDIIPISTTILGILLSSRRCNIITLNHT